MSARALVLGCVAGVVVLAAAAGWFGFARKASVATPAVASECFDSTNAEKAIDVCTRALADRSLSSSDRSLVLARRADAYANLARYHDALNDLAAAVAADPTLADPVSERGFVRMQMGDYAAAIVDYTQAISLNAQFTNPYEGRAWAYLQMGEFAKSVADYNRSIGLQPNRASAYADRGFAYAGLGDVERAVADYATAIKLDPGYHLAYDRRGLLYQGQGKYDLAKREFDAAIKASATDYIAYNNRCYNYAILGDIPNALNDCDRSLDLQSPTHENSAQSRSDYAGTLDSRGYAYLRDGDFDDAIADYNQALKVDPKIPESLFGRAVAYAGKGDMTSAERDIVAARQLNPDVDAVMGKVHITAPGGL